MAASSCKSIRNLATIGEAVWKSLVMCELQGKQFIYH